MESGGEGGDDEISSVKTSKKTELLNSKPAGGEKATSGCRE